MSEPKKLPSFASESEEADWWFENREKHAEDALQNIAEGGVSRGRLARRVATAQGFTPIDLDTEDISKARVFAGQRGLEVTSYLKMLLHEALERETQQPR